VLFTFDDAYEDLVEFAFPVLQRHGFTAAVFVVTGHLGGTNVWDAGPGAKPRRLMTRDQIAEWSRRGIEFGAHTRSHADLTTLGPAALSAEVQGCRDDLTAVLLSRPCSFAYPYGRTTAAVELAVRGAFDLAFTVREGLNTASTPRHLMRRVMVQPSDGPFSLAVSLRLGSNPLNRLRARIRVRSRLRAVLGHGRQP
jgi:peptidoglycan/xylan/chitin deacetylase (PgdA/CDA1 family)